MGGGSALSLESPANGLRLHRQCHQKVESSRAQSRMYGWLLGPNDNASQRPVKLWDGWFYLTYEGSRLNADSPADVNAGDSRG